MPIDGLPLEAPAAPLNDLLGGRRLVGGAGAGLPNRQRSTGVGLERMAEDHLHPHGLN